MPKVQQVWETAVGKNLPPETTKHIGTIWGKLLPKTVIEKNRHPNMTKTEHVLHIYVICCRPEVDGDVISSLNVKIIGNACVAKKVLRVS